jgi:hypothetical protein
MRGCPTADWSSVDTAIWTKPGGNLAGQLLYGDSLQCSNLLPTSMLICADGSDRFLGSHGVQRAYCPAKSYFLLSTREAGLVQIANALTESQIIALRKSRS